MKVIPNPRYERKLVASGASLHEILAMVRRHPAGFREVYAERIINNIYLDSPSLTNYLDHVNGTPNRVKVRVRWYGPPEAGVRDPALERKLKRGHISGKIVDSLPGFSPNGAGIPAALKAAFAGPSFSKHLRNEVLCLEASLLNRYSRRYFLSADCRFRLTADFDLRFGRPADAALQFKPLQPLVVLELKFAPQHADAAERITNVFPFRVRRCSKYVLGIEQLTASGRISAAAPTGHSPVVVQGGPANVPEVLSS